MTSTDALRWAETALASGATFVLVVTALKNVTDVLKNCVELRKNWLEAQLKAIELKAQNPLIVKATIEDIEKYGVNPRAEFRRAFRSVAVIIALLAIAGASWAAVVAKRALNDAAAARATLEQTRKELEKLKNTPQPTLQTPPIRSTNPAPTDSTKVLGKVPKPQSIQHLVEQEIVEGPPQIIVQNDDPNQSVVVDVDGTSSAHLTIGPNAKGRVPDVVEGGKYSIKITGANTIVSTANDIIPNANVHYIIKVPPAGAPFKVRKK